MEKYKRFRTGMLEICGGKGVSGPNDESLVLDGYIVRVTIRMA